MKDFFIKNKVFFLGLLAALAVVVQQFAVEPVIDWAAVGFAALMATLSYIANQWRGQGLTLTGVIGTLASVFVTNFNGGHINMNQFILLALAAVLSAVAPPAKPASYEQDPAIKNAKS